MGLRMLVDIKEYYPSSDLRFLAFFSLSKFSSILSLKLGFLSLLLQLLSNSFIN
ncbi:hypothetical protein Hanom_Chr10g00955081 [Helianthus anomalus]